jgi:hypothetical protein
VGGVEWRGDDDDGAGSFWDLIDESGEGGTGYSCCMQRGTAAAFNFLLPYLVITFWTRVDTTFTLTITFTRKKKALEN